MNILFKRESSKNFESIVKDFKKEVDKSNFGILWQLDLSEKIQSKGIHFSNKYLIFEVCNPKMAKKVLDINLDSGVFLPCKIVLYKKGDKTIVGMAKPTDLIKLVEPSANSIAKKIKEELIQVIENIV